EDGRPVRGSIGWRQDFPRGGYKSSGARLEEDGSFVIKGLRPGPFRMSVNLGARRVDLGEHTAPAEDVVITVH
ncbi:MAG: hypothetical protein ACYTDY_10735, partial [Planctomycetota bacterium]